MRVPKDGVYKSGVLMGYLAQKKKVLKIISIMKVKNVVNIILKSCTK